jgi:diacylglycerol kinase (ATP)
MSDNKGFSIESRIKSFKYALGGIVLLVRTQHNARIHALATLVVCAAGFYFGITKMEWCFIVFAISIVWTAEALNTALEFMGDAVSPGHNKLIGKAKDIAAAGVLIASIGAAVIGVIIFGPYVLELVKPK